MARTPKIYEFEYATMSSVRNSVMELASLGIPVFAVSQNDDRRAVLSSEIKELVQRLRVVVAEKKQSSAKWLHIRDFPDVEEGGVVITPISWEGIKQVGFVRFGCPE